LCGNIVHNARRTFSPKSNIAISASGPRGHTRRQSIGHEAVTDWLLVVTWSGINKIHTFTAKWQNAKVRRISKEASPFISNHTISSQVYCQEKILRERGENLEYINCNNNATMFCCVA
jgi:hypothetical protein